MIKKEIKVNDNFSVEEVDGLALESTKGLFTLDKY